jgi:hypothetical protein
LTEFEGKVEESRSAFAEFILLQTTAFKLKIQLCYFQEAVNGPYISEVLHIPEEMIDKYGYEMSLHDYAELHNLRVVNVNKIEEEYFSF